MVRALFYTGAAILICSAALIYLPSCFLLIMGIAFLAAAIAFTIFCRKTGVFKTVASLAILAVFCLTGYFNLIEKVIPAQKLSGSDATIIGTIAEDPQYNKDYSVYIIKAERIRINNSNGSYMPKKLQNIKIRITDSGENYLKIYDRVELDIKLTSLDEYRLSSLSDNILAAGTVERFISKRGTNRPFYAIFHDLREAVSSKFSEVLSTDDVAFANAILLGNKMDLDDDFNYCVKAAGVSHVLVVSGMHLGIIFQIFGAVFSLFCFSKRFSAFLQLGIIFSIMAVCGFTPSIMRAGLAYALVCLGAMLRLKSDALNALGFAAIISAFINPFIFFNVSAMLSFFSTFGLLFVCPILYNKITLKMKSKKFKPVKALIFAILQTITATFFTFPIIVCYFGYISVISPVTNILIDYVASVLICLLLALAIMLFVPSVLTATPWLTIRLSSGIIDYIKSVITYMANIKGSVAPVGKYLIIPWAIILVSLILIVIKPNIKRKSMKNTSIITSVVLFVVSIVCGYAAISNQPKVIVKCVKAGNGVSVVISSNEYDLIVGAGDGRNDCNAIKTALLQSGRTKADVLLLPSLEKNVAKGAPQLINHLSIDKVVYPDSGEFSDELDYLSQGKKDYEKFHNVAIIKPEKICTAYCLADLGAVVNIENKSVIVFTGNGDCKKLLDCSCGKEKILICNKYIPSKLDLSVFSAIIICTDDSNIAKYKRIVHGKDIKNVDYNNNKTITL